MHGNTERNYTIRIILLASAGNPYRQKNINVQVFDELVNVYHNWDKYTISDKYILEQEAEILSDSMQRWELHNSNKVRNWSLRLSSILDLEVISAHISNLFIQRMGAFQNAGFGHPIFRIHRTVKLVELMDNRSSGEFSNIFLGSIGLSPSIYFKQFLACLALFGWLSRKKGFCDSCKLPDIDNQLQESGITMENLKLFIKQNSTLFSTQSNISFRDRVNRALNNIPDFYKPLFYNQFLEVPFIELKNKEFCLPDPFSLTESCWNRMRDLVVKNISTRKLRNLLSYAFEDYLKDTLLPYICSNNEFEKIPEVKNPSSSRDKRADFLVRTESAYIIIECKNSVMSSDTSAFFQVDKLADLWCRVHSASEQIAMTVQALELHDRPVIPLILTFYDSTAASTVFEKMVKHTDYCSRMGLDMPPVVYSLHEFEHWIFNRSLSNWVKLILSKWNSSPPVKPDNKGHDYKHLDNISIL